MVIDLVEVGDLVNLPELLEYRVIEKCVCLFNSKVAHTGRHRKQAHSDALSPNCRPSRAYTALIDMGMIWRMASPSAEDFQTEDGTPYK